MQTQEEIWKDVVGYEGLYQVSNFGRVKSMDRYINGKHLKSKIKISSFDTKGYKFVWLSKENTQKMFRIHRLVAIAFIPLVEGKDNIDHINGIKDDNRVENLRWCTKKENMNFPIAKENCRKPKLGNKYWLGKHHTDETKKKISENMKGEKSVWFGKKHSLESRRKMSINRKGKFVKPVEQYTLDGKLIKIWDSMVQVEQELGLSHGNIRKCCIGKNRHCGGFMWKYKNETDK